MTEPNLEIKEDDESFRISYDFYKKAMKDLRTVVTLQKAEVPVATISKKEVKFNFIEEDLINSMQVVEE